MTTRFLGTDHRGLYGFPNVGRFGLAHSLLAWARCELWCSDNHVPMLAPNWAHLRLGPYLRRELDKRAYHRLFHFPHYISGIRKAVVRATRRNVCAEDIDLESSAAHGRNLVVVFNNLVGGNDKTYFGSVVGRQAHLRRALIAMTRANYLPDAAFEPHIALHVRFGDFTAAISETELTRGTRNARIPIEWYCGILRSVRACLGGDVLAKVYSDGNAEQLSPLLAEANIDWVRGQQSITDLLAISQAAALVSSGSGFSIWGAFLGDVPRICFPGQRHVRVFAEPSGVDLEPECRDGGELNQGFVDAIRRKLAARAAV